MDSLLPPSAQELERTFAALFVGFVIATALYGECVAMHLVAVARPHRAYRLDVFPDLPVLLAISQG